MAKKVIVRMLRSYGANVAGEVCGFEAELAKHLVSHKYAEPVKEEKKATPQAPPAK